MTNNKQLGYICIVILVAAAIELNAVNFYQQESHHLRGLGLVRVIRGSDYKGSIGLSKRRGQECALKKI